LREQCPEPVERPTDWARENGKLLFPGEFMGGNPQVEGQEGWSFVIPQMCQRTAASPNEW